MSKAVQHNVRIDLRYTKLQTDTTNEAKELRESIEQQPGVELSRVYGSEVLRKHEVPTSTRSNTHPHPVFCIQVRDYKCECECILRHSLKVTKFGHEASSPTKANYEKTTLPVPTNRLIRKRREQA